MNYDALAKLWFETEWNGQKDWSALAPDEQQTVIDRVQAIADGTFKSADCTTGDIAVRVALSTSSGLTFEDQFVWGRYMKLPDDERRDREARRRPGPGPRLVGVRERRLASVYDSFELSELGRPPIFLFGNRNVGYRERTNLTVPGQLSDQTFFIAFWHVEVRHLRTPEEKQLTRELLEQLHFTLFIGDMPQTEAFGHQLAYPRRRPASLIVPLRQHFRVRAEWYRTAQGDYFNTIKPARLYVHLDGLQTRDVF